MQRVVIIVDGAGDNAGSPTVLAIQGTIRAVQFALSPDLSIPAIGSIVQVSTQPSLSSPIQNTGQNPPEIALAVYSVLNITTATQAQVAVVAPANVIPADFPVSIGNQIFVNARLAVQGFIVLMIE
jgi:hypothetical protein